MLKTAVLCFTLHLLEKVGGSSVETKIAEEIRDAKNRRFVLYIAFAGKVGLQPPRPRRPWVGTEITRPRDGWHKNNSPKGWTDGELHGQHKSNSPKDGELNGRHGNNSPKGCNCSFTRCDLSATIRWISIARSLGFCG